MVIYVHVVLLNRIDLGLSVRVLPSSVADMEKSVSWYFVRTSYNLRRTLSQKTKNY
jgi:hypothetical protein